MATIKPDRIFSFKSNIELTVLSNNFVGEGSVSIDPLYPPETTNLVFLVVYYEMHPYMKQEGTNLEAELIAPFEIKEASNLTIEDLFNCVEQTRNHFQAIFDAIFLPIIITVPPVAFEDMKPKLIAHLNDIKQELSKQ